MPSSLPKLAVSQQWIEQRTQNAAKNPAVSDARLESSFERNMGRAEDLLKTTNPANTQRTSKRLFAANATSNALTSRATNPIQAIKPIAQVGSTAGGSRLSRIFNSKPVRALGTAMDAVGVAASIPSSSPFKPQSTVKGAEFSLSENKLIGFTRGYCQVKRALEEIEERPSILGGIGRGAATGYIAGGVGGGLLGGGLGYGILPTREDPRNFRHAIQGAMGGTLPGAVAGTTLGAVLGGVRAAWLRHKYDQEHATPSLLGEPKEADDHAPGWHRPVKALSYAMFALPYLSSRIHENEHATNALNAVALTALGATSADQIRSGRDPFEAWELAGLGSMGIGMAHKAIHDHLHPSTGH